MLLLVELGAATLRLALELLELTDLLAVPVLLLVELGAATLRLALELPAATLLEGVPTLRLSDEP